MAAQPPAPREDTVDALLETVRELLRAEDSRATSLTARGSGLAGFVGLIISLSATVGQRAVSASLPPGWKAATIALFALALIALVSAVIVVVLRVLLPQSYRNLAMSEVSRYPLPEFVYAEKVMVQGRTMRGHIDALATERDRNDGKARGLRCAYLLLIAGLGLAAVDAVILALHAAQVL
jgi:ABC-type transport system involved in multi-copper enzyme maturation permease subunit